VNVYSSDPLLIEMGARPYVLAAGDCFYAKLPNGKHDTSAVDLDVVSRTVREWPKGQRVLLDIEAFDNDTSKAVRNIAAAMWTWKHRDPSAVLGIYRKLVDMVDAHRKILISLTDIGVSSGDLDKHEESLAIWQSANERFAHALGEAIDFICPNAYAYDNGAHWLPYVHGSLIEARRLCMGKPVVPIVWPVFRELKPIPLDTWTAMCRWLVSHPCVDEITVFTHPKYDGAAGWREALMSECA
jgi:hypothetical protein